MAETGKSTRSSFPTVLFHTYIKSTQSSCIIDVCHADAIAGKRIIDYYSESHLGQRAFMHDHRLWRGTPCNLARIWSVRPGGLPKRCSSQSLYKRDWRDLHLALNIICLIIQKQKQLCLMSTFGLVGHIAVGSPSSQLLITTF
jgi:hypothetical protein